jgi:predicted small secreted protein
MNWKSFIVGIGIGAIGGVLLKDTISSSSFVSAEKVLQDVKKSFKQDESIDGSWIEMKPENYEKHSHKTKIYRGGISKRTDSELQQFEFIVDAYTGTLMDLYPIS